MEKMLLNMLESKKGELSRLEDKALRCMNYIQNLDTPYELALFGKDKMEQLIETQTLIGKVSEDIRMMEYLLREAK